MNKEDQINKTIASIGYAEVQWINHGRRALAAAKRGNDSLKAAHVQQQDQWMDHQVKYLERLSELVGQHVNDVAVIVGVYNGLRVNGVHDAETGTLHGGWEAAVCAEVRAHVGLDPHPWSSPGAAIVLPPNDGENVVHMVSAFDRQGDLLVDSSSNPFGEV